MWGNKTWDENPGVLSDDDLSWQLPGTGSSLPRTRSVGRAQGAPAGRLCYRSHPSGVPASPGRGVRGTQGGGEEAWLLC